MGNLSQTVPFSPIFLPFPTNLTHFYIFLNVFMANSYNPPPPHFPPFSVQFPPVCPHFPLFFRSPCG